MFFFPLFKKRKVVIVASKHPRMFLGHSVLNIAYGIGEKNEHKKAFSKIKPRGKPSPRNKLSQIHSQYKHQG